MIQVEVDKASASPDGLRCGCVVRYGEGGPVRFVEVFLPYAVLDRETRAEIIVAFDKAVGFWLDHEPDQPELPFTG